MPIFLLFRLIDANNAEMLNLETQKIFELENGKAELASSFVFIQHIHIEKLTKMPPIILFLDTHYPKFYLHQSVSKFL